MIKQEKKHKGSRVWIVLLVLLIIVIGIFVGGLSYLGLISLPEDSAKLINVQGDVQVANSPFQPAKEGMSLRKGSIVKTGQNGSVDMVLFGGSVVRIDKDTQFQISEIVADKDKRTVKLDQTKGRTWTKLLPISGIKDYRIDTPDGSAKATEGSFFVSVGNTSKVGVGEGTVTVKTNDRETNLTGNEQIDIGSTEKNTMQRDSWVSNSIQQDNGFIDDTAAKLKAKYANLINIAKSQYGITDTQIDSYLYAYLRGDYSPERIEEMKKSYGINIDLTL
ncbi:MAG: FecR family protein [Candidatus Aenigmarchaeota archaeon]|nr:FecR family protein [Candidatus Aenigmarchaeota archaeon]